MVLDSITHLSNMRKDLVLTDELKKFLSEDFGKLDKSVYKNKLLDINYYQNRKLDIYYPDVKKDKYPVFLIVFDGGFLSGSKELAYIDLMLKPLKYGYACIVIDYTLALDEVFPRCLIDVKHSIDFIHSYSDKYHLDDNNISLWGESSGGYLGLGACLIDNGLLNLNINTSVKNMIIYYPIVDLRVKSKSEICNDLIDALLGDDNKYLSLANPIDFINDKMPSLYLWHGRSDSLVDVSQSLMFIEKMKKYPSVHFKYELLENEEHCSDAFFCDKSINKIMNFVKGEEK